MSANGLVGGTPHPACGVPARSSLLYWQVKGLRPISDSLGLARALPLASPLYRVGWFEILAVFHYAV
jgi:hypothetical protein